MEKALLDNKDIMPDYIIDELTDKRCEYQDNTAVGYIEDIAVAFSWHGNTMEIINIFDKHNDGLKSNLTELFHSLLDGSKVIAKLMFVGNRCFAHFYWAE